MSLSVAVSGATGRLGHLIADLVERDDHFTLHAAMDSSTPDEAMSGADILIDVTRIDVSERLVDEALRRGLQVVVGTSGWDRDRLAALESRIPASRGVIVVPNFSLGSVLATVLAETAAPYFDAVEIIEAHHEGKVDSPSGTAVRTAERIAAAAGHAFEAPYAEQEARGRVVDGVPVHALRLRGVVAEQRVLFGGEGELLEVRHETLSSTSYLAGVRAALLAAPEARGLTVGLDRVLGIGAGA